MAAATMEAQTESYQFSAQPRVVRSRKKYRDPQQEDAFAPSNIMYDKRVVRGNTYAAMVIPAHAQPDPIQMERERDSQKRKTIKSRTQKHSIRRPPGTPEPMDGRKHIDIQTDSYLEELSEKPAESTHETQTDFFLDRPSSPLFMPAKTGQDVSTQIEDGDLFNFDLEVQPILEVLVGKTLEQSMMEVLEEEELAAMRKHQEEFEQIRNAELIETQRMEAAEQRRFEEMERRKLQQRARLQQELIVKQKVAARAFAKEYLQDLKSGVFRSLEDSGHFRDPVQASIQENFMPWLLDAVSSAVNHQSTLRDLAQELVTKAAVLALDAHGDTLSAERNRIEDERRVVREAKEALERAEREERERLEEEERKRLQAEEAEENDEEEDTENVNGETGVSAEEATEEAEAQE
eukprot:GILK01000447.1.p1 GENE.GILK01000447.1~~GILK01000447.1.p1  ORF type:complete len:406 (-),score=110.30 GILK01000447.1:257-1474(-)